MAATNPHKPKKVALIAYDDVNAVDVFGPLQVFESVNLIRRRLHPNCSDAYQTKIISLGQEQITLATHTKIISDMLLDDLPQFNADTFMIAGGEASSDIAKSADVLEQLTPIIQQTARVASDCSGALILAATGALNGRKATTHWSRHAEFSKKFPEVKLDIDAVFTQDGKYYCSAGVTSGIDLALHLVQEDYGRRIALEASREMVAFYHRPGGQNQFSDTGNAGTAKTKALINAQHWIKNNLNKPIEVSLLAEQAAMSVRNFSRKFTQEVGIAPSRYIAQVRLNKARLLLEETTHSISRIADQCGYSNSEILRRLFIRELNVSPSEYRKRFQTYA
jgi:transcriptional regulator GlxA family with amidase domain